MSQGYSSNTLCLQGLQMQRLTNRCLCGEAKYPSISETLYKVVADLHNLLTLTFPARVGLNVDDIRIGVGDREQIPLEVVEILAGDGVRMASCA